MRILIPLIALMANFSYAQAPSINEVLSSNTSVNTDEDGHYSDWVELYNPHPQAVSLNGYGLSDNPSAPFKWTFPDVALPAGGYLLIWCSDKDRAIAGNPLHTNFKISASGETLVLTSPDGESQSLNLPALNGNTSYGRVPNGSGEFLLLTEVTPGAPNPSSGSLGVLPKPEFSHAPGYFTSPFSLEISSPDPHATILYTLDGSKPDPGDLAGRTYQYKNSYQEMANQSSGPMLTQSIQTHTYSSPIEIVDRSALPNKISQISSTQHFAPVYLPAAPIFKATVVRAMSIREGYTNSPVSTATYIVNPAGTGVFSFPMLVSLSVDEDALFDYEEGIYVAGAEFDQWRQDNPTVNTTPYNFEANFYRKGDASERKAHVDMFVDGVQVINQDIGIRLSGDSSRAWPSKSFQLISRSEYGAGAFNFNFFPEVATSEFKRLLLRNSGNDFRRTMYRDALAHRLVADLMETQSYRPVITLLNGEYWGILNLRERYDRFYFKNLHGIDDGDLDLLENDLTAEEGDQEHYEAMESFLHSNSLAVQDNYDYIATQLDPDNFRDYYITNIYLSNADWPGWNTLFWRKRTAFSTGVPKAHDGRWRAAMKDADSGFGLTVNTNSHNTLEFATEPNGPSYPNPPRSTLVLRSLLENEGFKNNFINRFADLLNTRFSAEWVIGMSTEMKNVLDPEIQAHIDRWKAVQFVWWNIHIDNIHTYAQQRPDLQRSHIRQKFQIDSDVLATLDVSSPSHGYVRVNTIDLLPTTPGVQPNPYPWTGKYFTGIPMTLRATPRPGYVFSHWEGDVQGSDAEIAFTPETDFQAIAVFMPDPTPQVQQLLYFWTFDSAVPNDQPLIALASTYQAVQNPAALQFESSLSGYPFTAAHPNWRKASMERRNSPTPLNYIANANNGLDYDAANLKGLQIKQPFQSGSLQNQLIFNLPTDGFQDPVLSFAVMDEGAATGLTVHYRTNQAGDWQLFQDFGINQQYQVITADFSDIDLADGNPEFSVRIRFTGSNMQQDQGNRVTFNNVALHATPISLGTPLQQSDSVVAYPNPTDGVLFLAGISHAEYFIFGTDGKLVRQGNCDGQVDLNGIAPGMYLLHLKNNQGHFVKKIVRR